MQTSELKLPAYFGAVDSADMRVKLRHTVSNAKLPRTPYNLEQAALACVAEAVDLNGPEMYYSLVQLLAQHACEDSGLHNGEPVGPFSIVSKAVEFIVNMPRPTDVSPEALAREIVQVLQDMELIA